MKDFLLGHQRGTGKPVRVPKDAFAKHMHLIGATGMGKTVALLTILFSLFLDPFRKEACIIVDRMGGFSFDILRWVATHAPAYVRKRFLYIDAANENHVIGFNPLVHTTPGHGYFKVSRATELILRAWQSSNIEAMPRLARWLFNCFYGAAKLGLNIADCVHFLLPFSDLHRKLLNILPDQLRFEWTEIMEARGSQATVILESTRNRLKPYWECPILQQMFSVTDNRLDVSQWMQDGKIVLIDLSPKERIPEQAADALGGLILNQIISTARSLPHGTVYPVNVFLDEFQRFVGPDIEMAIPEMRQRGVRLFLSHQSFSQLERGDCDLTSIIWQPQTRLIFGEHGLDADLLADEMAKLTFDPKRIKDELYTRRQLVTGHRIVDLHSTTQSEQYADNWSEQQGQNQSWDRETFWNNTGNDWSTQQSQGKGSSRGGSTSTSTNQSLVPVYDEFLELCSRTYETFEEQKAQWGRIIRELRTGQALLKLADDPTLYHVNVKRTVPGSLAIDWSVVLERMPRTAESVYRLLEENFTHECFVSPVVVERERQERLDRVLRPRITVQDTQNPHYLPATMQPRPAAQQVFA